MSDMCIINFNTEWAKPGTWQGDEVQSRLSSYSADLMCLCEAYTNVPPVSGHIISPEQGWGYPAEEGRRKVLLWSPHPWQNVEEPDFPDFPGGRMIKGVTTIAGNSVLVIGVCIPWKDAHVRSGRKDRAPWEDHLKFIEGLSSVIGNRDRDLSCVLMGDFNQRIPRKWSPQHVFDALTDCLTPDLTVVTAGMLAGLEKQAIDHIAVSKDFSLQSVGAISNVTDDGREISDHFGLVADLDFQPVE